MIKFDADGQMYKIYTLDTINYRSTTGEKLPVDGIILDRMVKEYAEAKNMPYDEALIEVSQREPKTYRTYIEQKQDFNAY